MGKEINVLVVDDSSSMRLAVTTTLSAVGYHVQEACDGQEALKLAEQNQFDLIRAHICHVLIVLRSFDHHLMSSNPIDSIIMTHGSPIQAAFDLKGREFIGYYTNFPSRGIGFDYPSTHGKYFGRSF